MYKGERFNSISHLVGASLALVGGAVLVTFAAMSGETEKIVSYSIYALTLFHLYLTSTLYHSFPGPTICPAIRLPTQCRATTLANS